MNEQPRRPLGPQPWEVVRNKLDGIANEMESTLLRSSFSPVVKEGLEVTEVIIQEGVPTYESINGAIAEPCESTISEPRSAIATMIGSSQYFFSCRRNCTNSASTLDFDMMRALYAD